MKWRIPHGVDKAHLDHPIRPDGTPTARVVLMKKTVPPFLSRPECESLVAQIRGLASSRGVTRLALWSEWRSDIRWARNRVSIGGDWRDRGVQIRRSERSPGAREGDALTNQLDALSLEAAMRWAERMWYAFGDDRQISPVQLASPNPTYAKTSIWSDPTYAMTSDRRSEIANQLFTGAESAGMLSAGYLSVRARGTTFVPDDGSLLYAPQTFAECSITVRDPEGTGSGWAGASSYDWTRFDVQKLADVALDKCLRSRNPVRIEPGHYTLIMEPQATFEMISLLFRAGFPYLDLQSVEANEFLPFHNGARAYPVSQWRSPEVIGKTKIGQRVLDARITVTYDPLDPDLGIAPFTPSGEPYVPVTWIENGVLTMLNYDREFALSILHEPLGKPNSQVFRMSGGTATIADMIASTKRGLLVTRFWNTRIIDEPSILSTGMTRDGLWLIENGAISHPVKNLRFTESPLFVFNQVEDLGVPVPVFTPELPAVVPPVKVRDFNFTSLVDAV